MGNLSKEKECPEEAAHTHAPLLEPKSILYINFTLKLVLKDSIRTSQYFVELPMGPVWQLKQNLSLSPSSKGLGTHKLTDILKINMSISSAELLRTELAASLNV